MQGSSRILSTDVPTDRQPLPENSTTRVAEGTPPKPTVTEALLFEIVAGKMTPGAGEVAE